MICEILTYGRSELRRKSEPVATVNDEIRSLADQLLQTMYDNKGLGLAAQQIGRTEAICVIDESPAQGENVPRENPDVPMPLILINPRITDSQGEQVGDEGCLSFPEIFVNVKRASEVTVQYLDRDGQEQSVVARGLLSRALQHEIDHLDGILLVDHMSPVQRIGMVGRLKRLKKSND